MLPRMRNFWMDRERFARRVCLCVVCSLLLLPLSPAIMMMMMMMIGTTLHHQSTIKQRSEKSEIYPPPKTGGLAIHFGSLRAVCV
uniref:Putative secreted protein n=1 Tax=Anopheles darlingi TaxID=43151 RepID=A0A2M4DMS0_ANODA